jgi:hypothetical protein
MSFIASAIAIATENIAASATEVYDRVLEDGLIKRVVETGIDDRETEGAP